MEIKLAFVDEEEQFIKDALETWLQMMSEEILDRDKLLQVLIACGLSCAYEYKKPEQVDDLVQSICMDLKDSLGERAKQAEMDSDKAEGEKNVH